MLKDVSFYIFTLEKCFMDDCKCMFEHMPQLQWRVQDSSVVRGTDLHIVVLTFCPLV